MAQHWLRQAKKYAYRWPEKLAGKGTDGAEDVGWFSWKMYWTEFLIEARDTLCIAWIG
jgi:hypothetical protein